VDADAWLRYPLTQIMRPSETTREQLLPLSTDAELRRRFMVLREPIPGNFRFGVLLEVLDRLAGETALQYIWRFVPDAGAVTAALDEIVVRRAPDVTQDVRCSARINHVGRTSMEVGIRVESAAERTHLASCYFTMVARAHDRSRSIEIPKLEPGDDLERVRAARAVTRRAAYRRELETAVEPPSRDEYMMLSALHRAQEAPGFQGLRASDLVAETWERTFPEQENPWRAIFGGYIMRRAYELSSICAERISQHGHRPVIAAVNRINFFHPVQIGDKLHLTSRIAYTEGPAICVETAIERISRDRTARALSNSCLFTFVDVDASLRASDVPPVHPSNYAEDARYLGARRNLHALGARSAKGWVLSCREGRLG
jgi:acyl-coenzyme A thioesterase 9